MTSAGSREGLRLHAWLAIYVSKVILTSRQMEHKHTMSHENFSKK
jgi:hypothetical protein